jgi:hypothetical protein
MSRKCGILEVSNLYASTTCCRDSFRFLVTGMLHVHTQAINNIRTWFSTSPRMKTEERLIGVCGRNLPACRTDCHGTAKSLLPATRSLRVLLFACCNRQKDPSSSVRHLLKTFEISQITTSTNIWATSLEAQLNNNNTNISNLLLLFLFLLSNPPLWSRGQSSWLQIQRSGFDSRRYQIFWEVVGLERGPLSLVKRTEELFERKNSGSGLEHRKYCHRDPSHWPLGTIYPQQLTLTSLGRYSSLEDFFFSCPALLSSLCVVCV